MSKHIKVDGQLLQVNKKFKDLKQKQQCKIHEWLYKAYKRQVAQNLTDDEALSEVFIKIDDAGIWIPEQEVISAYRARKTKYRKRMEATNMNDSFKFDYDAAANYWIHKDANSKKMDRKLLWDRINKFLEEHNTCTLGTSSERHVRCTPIEYNYVDSKLYFFSEGGLKFKGLKKNKHVGVAIYEPYNGFGNLKSLQIEGTANLVEPFSDEYLKLLEHKKIPVDAIKKLPQPMNLIRVVPRSFDYLDSDLKKEDLSSRQHYEE